MNLRHALESGIAVHRNPRRSRAELVAYQDAQLRRLLVHAYEQVPYYRALFDQNRLHPRHVRGTIDLNLIPITSKQDLRAQPLAKIVARGLDPNTLLTRTTSGSSGEPFTIRRTWLEQSVQYLHRLRAAHDLGAWLGDRTASVGVVRPADPNDRKLIGRTLHALGVKRTLIIDGLQPVEVVTAMLREFRPNLLTGLPGMLCRVAEHVVAQGIRDISPRLVVVGGEVLTPVMRRRLEEAFAAPVRETYGSHEFPLLGWECQTTGNFHICDDGSIVEVLHEGRPVKPGERGEVVATNLHAYAMPFIRYRLGDVVTKGDDHCSCGQPFSTIRAIQGRMIDYFRLPEGRVLHPYQIISSFIAGGDSWIRQYQLLQERTDRIVLRVLPVQQPAPELIARLERSVLPLLGPDVEFKVLVVDDLPLEQTGKFRPSRSLVHSEYDGEVLARA
jgi:phenylacetate-CoA ligase